MPEYTNPWSGGEPIFKLNYSISYDVVVDRSAPREKHTGMYRFTIQGTWKPHGNIKLGKIRYPARKLYYMDLTWLGYLPSQSYKEGDYKYYLRGSNITWSKGELYRWMQTFVSEGTVLSPEGYNSTPHTGRANIVWFDGHVSIEPDDFRDEDFSSSRCNFYIEAP